MSVTPKRSKEHFILEVQDEIKRFYNCLNLWFKGNDIDLGINTSLLLNDPIKIQEERNLWFSKNINDSIHPAAFKIIKALDDLVDDSSSDIINEEQIIKQPNISTYWRNQCFGCYRSLSCMTPIYDEISNVEIIMDQNVQGSLSCKGVIFAQYEISSSFYPNKNNRWKPKICTVLLKLFYDDVVSPGGMKWMHIQESFRKF